MLKPNYSKFSTLTSTWVPWVFAISKCVAWFLMTDISVFFFSSSPSFILWTTLYWLESMIPHKLKKKRCWMKTQTEKRLLVVRPVKVRNAKVAKGNIGIILKKDLINIEVILKRNFTIFEKNSSIRDFNKFVRPSDARTIHHQTLPDVWASITTSFKTLTSMHCIALKVKFLSYWSQFFITFRY